jgi:enamine deaminase RidA (YjgF/YER057c/UK114 family)
MKRALNPATVPASPYYAQGIEVTGATRTVFVSGQVGVDAQGATVEGIAGQAQQAVANLNAVLAEAGLEPDSIVKLTIYLTDPENVGPFIMAAGPTLPPDPPATTMLLVAGLAAPDLLVEVEAVAMA